MNENPLEELEKLVFSPTLLMELSQVYTLSDDPEFNGREMDEMDTSLFLRYLEAQKKIHSPGVTINNKEVEISKVIDFEALQEQEFDYNVELFYEIECYSKVVNEAIKSIQRIIINTPTLVTNPSATR